jgi:hypothetical protein
MQAPKCQKPTCTNTARLNHTGSRYLKYCSLECQWTHSSAKGADQRRETNIRKWGHPTNLQSAETKAKIKQTCEQRYGSSHAMRNNTVKQKLQQTKTQRYGDHSFNNRDKFQQTMQTKTPEELMQTRDQRIQTNREKYGVDFVLQSDTVRSSIAKTNLERYGVENAAQNPQVKQKIQKTMKDRFGCHFQQQHMTPHAIQCLNDPQWLLSNNHRLLIDIAQELGVTYHTVNRAFEVRQVQRADVGYNRSQGEKEIADWLISLGLNVRTNVRDQLNGAELDIWIPAKRLAIEYNGLFWHCEQNKPDKQYHQKKHAACVANQIQLIQITDWHWLNQQQLVQSRLLSKLGLCSNKIRARSCTVEKISAQQAAAFLDHNHIQGSCVAQVHLGLIHREQLVAVLSMGKSRFKSSAEWELIRFAVLQNTTCPGAASKLYAHFIREYQPQSVISYCDLSWNSGGLYRQLGFEWQRDNGTNYWYTYQYRTWENRLKYQKHKLAGVLDHFDPNQTEWQNMQAHGWDRYWDCGSSVWVWTASC